MMLGILNGRVYDPANNIDGEVRDIWIKDGKIVSPEEIELDKTKTIDVAGQVVMAGGVDIHAHVGGGKVNAGRKFRPEDSRVFTRSRTATTRSGSGRSVPSTFLTGYLYAEMGYTTVMEAASAPLTARHTHEELEDIPILDKAAFITMGNNHFIMSAIRDGELERARDYVAWLLEASKGYSIKIVNPGGVENWKWGKNVHTLDDPVIGFDVTPRQILTSLAKINDELALPHVPHIHGIRLGQWGNASTTVETIQALEGLRSHITHLQFFSYGGGDGKRPRSGAEEVARAVNESKTLTVDVGQVIFGDTTTMTSDGPLEFHLHQLTGNKWLNDDVETEAGGGVVPMLYKPKVLPNAVQWLTGMELFMLIDDPWKVFLTTDHPNGGPFYRYPQVIKLLMDRDYRAEVLDGLNVRARRDSLLPGLDREYSLYDIAIISRAGTARALGLKDKGHLGIGADADVSIYLPQDDKEEMFAHPTYVIKDGEIVVRDGKVVADHTGRTLYIAPYHDHTIDVRLREDFQEHYTISFDNYAVESEYLTHSQQITCGK